MKRLILAAAVAALLPIGAYAQSDADLSKGDTNTKDIFYGGGYSQNRYSPLDKVNTKNVHELVPIFAYQLSNDKAQEEQPILYQGVFYFADHDATMAVDARTGKQLWKNQVKYPDDLAKEICADRSAAASPSMTVSFTATRSTTMFTPMTRSQANSCGSRTSSIISKATP